MALFEKPIKYELFSFTDIKKDVPIHRHRVRKDGIVDGHEFETYYQVAEKIIDYGDFLGVVLDDGASGFFETRVPKAVLKEVLEKD